MRADGLHVTAAACNYMRPLIEGEIAPPVVAGLPDYGRWEWTTVARRLPAWQA